MIDEQRVKEVWPQVLKHGRDCPKVEHLGAGYLHEADDDGPYDVDGIAYCGRCHRWLGADAASRLPKVEVAICPKCHKPHYNMEDTAMCAAAVLIKEETMPINKFRKKPVVIEAWDAHQLLIFAAGSWKDLPVQIRDAYERGDVIFARDHIVIKTLEGDHRAEPSDKVICGVRGELYPCKPDIFAATYEPETK